MKIELVGLHLQVEDVVEIASWACAESRITSAILRCSLESGVLSSTSVVPITPFIGVRISWLIVARNWLFAMLASSALSLACRSSCAMRCCFKDRVLVETDDHVGQFVVVPGQRQRLPGLPSPFVAR